MSPCKGKGKGRKVLSLICAVMLVLVQLVFVVPAIQEAFAETGGDLEVRIKYFGEQENKIRTKYTFSAAELQAMNVQEWCYSNVTKVGTVMVMKARGPQVLEVIEAAGIDLNSVQRVNFRAGDNYGYTRDFTVAHHLSSGRYYYPNLNGNYIRGEDETTLTPKEGALDGACEVPAILALEFGATKASGKRAESLSLGTDKVYRFCLGQTPLQEMTPTGGSGDVTSAESIYLIHGIDVTLYGSPVDDIMMDISDGEMKVGSKKKVNVSFSGDELFADDLSAFAGKLKWKSSDPSVVKVDQKGNITVLKNGTATITVTAENGMSASVTINGVGETKNKEAAGNKPAGNKSAGNKAEANKAQETKTKDSKKKTTVSDQKAAGKSANKPTSRPTGKTKNTSSSMTKTTEMKAQAKKTITVREINIGDLVAEEPSVQDQMRESMAADTEALGKVKEFGKGAAAGTAGGAVLVGGAGAFFRVRRFWRDTL